MRVLAVAVVGVILLLTLYPSGQTLPADGWVCALCDPRVAADAAANLLLFVPLGLVLALLGWSPIVILAAAALLTVGIETTQFVLLPNRDANLLDALFNTLGAGAGALLHRGVRSARALTPEQSNRWAWIYAAGLLLTVVGTAILLAPAPPALEYEVRWEESPGGLEPFGGRVLSATLGGHELPRQHTIDSQVVRGALRRGERLDLSIIAGPPPGELSHVFSLHDTNNREVVLVAVHGHDLLLRYRTRAAALRLDQPSHRLAGALSAVSSGDPVRIETWGTGPSLCAALNGDARCGFGAGAARGWSFLLFAELFSPEFKRLLDFGWIAVLALPLGFLLRRGTAAAWTLGLLATGLLVIGFAGAPLGWAGWLGMGAGVLLGAGARAALQKLRFVAPSLHPARSAGY